ncbi:MAG: hypothetical protein ACI9BD_000186 [Candidatus Marinamargulisbacteria bacterium]|jgi:hypothetical protein
MRHRWKLKLSLILIALMLPLGTVTDAGAKPSWMLNDFFPDDYEVFWSFDVHNGAFTLSDAADSLYIGTLTSAIGAGGYITILYKLGDDLSVGGNFNFAHNGFENATNYVDFYLPSVGPTVKFEIDDIPVFISANIHLGWVKTEAIGTCTATICPRGEETANVTGWTLSARSLFPVFDTVQVGPFASLGTMTIAEYQYKRKGGSGNYNLDSLDIGISYLKVGASLYF